MGETLRPQMISGASSALLRCTYLDVCGHSWSLGSWSLRDEMRVPVPDPSAIRVWGKTHIMNLHAKCYPEFIDTEWDRARVKDEVTELEPAIVTTGSTHSIVPVPHVVLCGSCLVFTHIWTISEETTVESASSSMKGCLSTKQVNYPLRVSRGKRIKTQLPYFLPSFLLPSVLPSIFSFILFFLFSFCFSRQGFCV